MADKDITIGIKTTGAKNTAREIDDVADSIKDSGSNSVIAARSIDALENELHAATAAYRAAEIGSDEFITAQKRAADAQKSLDRAMQSAAAAGLNMRSTISNVGYQIQDFAVQTASGTSAVRAFGQQAPQLLSAFGPWGIVAGTAVAVAAPLITSLFQLGETAEEAGFKVEDMAEAIELANQRLIQGLTEGLAAQVRDQAALRESFAETEKAQGEAAKSTLENDERIRQSKISIAEALGLQIDRYKEIDALAAADAAKRKLEADQAIATENARLEKARQDRADAEAAKASVLQRQQEIQRALQKAEEELAAARAERARLQSIADKGGGIFNDPVQNAEAANAKNRLDNVVAKQKLAELEDLVKQLSASNEQFEGVNGLLREANVKIQETINREADTAAAVKIKVQELEQNRAVEDELAKLDTFKARQDQQAKDLSAAVEQIETTTAAGEAAKQTLLGAAADGKITADETQRVAQATGQLIAQMQAGLATAGSNTQQVLGILRTITEQEARNGREIQVLKRQVDQLFSRIR